MSRRRPFTVSASLSHRLNILALALVTLIVVTGGAVRLTGSGLGCSDWPECSVGHLTPAVQFHGLIEFGNRLVTVVLTIVVAAAFLAAVFRRPRRRDLIWLSGGLVVGILAQAVLGGIVVYTKLNPYLVMVHFFATMVLLVNAVVLVHRSTRDYGPGSGHLLIPRSLLHLFYGVLVVLGFVIAAGTAATGAGPLGGESSGQVIAKRIPVSLRDLAELHASLVMLLVGLTVGLVVGLHMARRARAGAAGGARAAGGDGGAGCGGVHAVFHPPARSSGGSPPPRGDHSGHRRHPMLPGLYLPRPRLCDVSRHRRPTPRTA